MFRAVADSEAIGAIRVISAVEIVGSLLMIVNVPTTAPTHQTELDSAGMRSGSEEASYLRLVDFCITQL